MVFLLAERCCAVPGETAPPGLGVVGEAVVEVLAPAVVDLHCTDVFLLHTGLAGPRAFHLCRNALRALREVVAEAGVGRDADFRNLAVVHATEHAFASGLRNAWPKGPCHGLRRPW